MNLKKKKKKVTDNPYHLGVGNNCKVFLGYDNFK